MFLHVILNKHKMQKKIRCTILTFNDAHIRNLSGKKSILPHVYSLAFL